MIRSETIREQVASYLRDMILQYQFKPGERVLEQEIADALGVSRGPIRESLRQLEQEGLVEYQRNRGCIVRKFRKEDAFEVFFIRGMLEISSVVYCGGVLPVESLDAMEQALERMRAEIANNSEKGFVQEDQVFHEAIAKACGLERLYEMWNSLSSVNIALFLTDNRKDFVLTDQYQRHKELLEVLREQDIVKSSNAIKAHYATTTALNR